MIRSPYLALKCFLAARMQSLSLIFFTSVTWLAITLTFARQSNQCSCPAFEYSRKSPCKLHDPLAVIHNGESKPSLLTCKNVLRWCKSVIITTVFRGASLINIVISSFCLVWAYYTASPGFCFSNSCYLYRISIKSSVSRSMLRISPSSSMTR